VHSNADVRILFTHFAGDVEFGGGSVEVGGYNTDSQGYADGFGDGAAGRCFFGNFADSGGTEEVFGTDEVVEVPLRV